jgi:hypothetical protein
MNVLITRPDHDIATHYISKWSEPLIKECRKRGVKLYDLKRNRANSKIFCSIVRSKKPDFLILNGHGTESTIFGYNDEPLLSVQNASLLEKGIVYSIACEAARKLGPALVKHNVRAYIGYLQKFIFIIDQNKASRPLSDELAEPFFISTNRVPESIIKGNTVKKALENAKNEYLYKP